jgi:EAL domain-containing protein (putative c-di-GMP-specific phosphodiesterase class I)
MASSSSFPLSTLTVALQPVWDLVQDRIVGYEALLRGPGGGALDVPALLLRAEAEGWLPALLHHGWTAAATAAERWLRADEWLFVNWDARAPLPGTAPWPHTVVELTENAVPTKETLADIHALRARHALDDLYPDEAAIAARQGLPFDIIKLDRTWLQHLARMGRADQVGQEAMQRVRAAGPGALVVAEGVEDTTQLRVLARLGLTHAQGFALGRPSIPPSRRPTSAVVEVPSPR